MPRDIDRVLESLAGEISTASWIALVGFDGLTIASNRENTETSENGDYRAAEYSALMGRLATERIDLRLGPVQEVTITANDMILLMQTVDDDCFLVCVMGNEGSVGRARYLLNVGAERLKHAFE